MSRRGWGIVTGSLALVTVAGGVVGNHLPWPTFLDRHPLWVTTGLFVLAAVAAVVTAILFYRDDSRGGDLGPTHIATAGAGGSATIGDGNVVAGPGGVAVGQGSFVVLPVPVQPIEPLPVPKVDLCVGRDSDVMTVVAAWTAGRTVGVLGGPGIGKSTVLGRAIGHEKVVAMYGSRRFVVSCDGADSAQIMVDKAAQVLGVPLGDHLWNRVVSFLRASPCVLVLDNFETVADADLAGAVRFATTLCADASPIILGFGYRGVAIPIGIRCPVEILLGPLPHDAAVELFLAVGGRRHDADPNLGALITNLDGVPLAIVLLAALARSESSLGSLAIAWRAKRTDLLQRTGRPDRTSSLPASIELSWDRIGADARAALSLASMLPDGWLRDRSTSYLPESLVAGVIELGNHALLHDDKSRRRCLTPIRQHVLIHHPPEKDHLESLHARIRALAERCREVGGPEGADVITVLAPEFTNIVEVIRAGLKFAPEMAAVVPGLLEFEMFTGIGDDQVGLDALAASSATLVQAANAYALGCLYNARNDNERACEMLMRALFLYRSENDVTGEANCQTILGQIEFRTSRNDRAKELFEQALQLYQKTGNVLGIATCIRGLGQVESRASNNDEARELFEHALVIYRQLDSVLGEANCLNQLGCIDSLESNDVQARKLFGQALALYRRVGDVKGQANCLTSQGEIEFRALNNSAAREYFDQALSLNRQIGNILGESTCLIRMGAVEFRAERNQDARGLFESARSLTRQVGNVRGEAHCLIHLAQIESLESNNPQARQLLEQALPLYQQVGDIQGEASCMASLGEVEFRTSNSPRARELFTQALVRYEKVGDRHSQALAHAWLVRTTNGQQQMEHSVQMAAIATELGHCGYLESLRAIAGC